MELDYLNYRGQDTRTFAEVFPSDVAFEDWYNNCGLPKRLLETDPDEENPEYDYSKYGIKTIYALLIAEYANDHIASYDENRFKYKVMSIIYEAGPAWQRAMAIQDKLLTMGNTLIFKGSSQHAEHEVDWTKQNQQLGNVAQHPDSAGPTGDTNSFGDTVIGTRSESVLPYISEQRTGYDKGHTKDKGSNDTTWTKDNVKGLVELLYSLDDTLCSRFIYRFKKLFQKFAYGNRPPLLFMSED